MKATAQNPGSVHFSLPEAIFEAVVFPLRSYSKGKILMPSGNVWYPAPVNLHEMALEGGTLRASKYQLFGIQIDIFRAAILMQIMLIPGIALAFLLLPFSRHMAKVRWVHIFRVLLYSLFLPVTMFVLLVILFGMGTLIAFLEPLCYWLGDILLTYGVWTTLIAWWALAIKHYLKMPHGWVVAILFAMMIALLTVTGMFLLTPSLVINV